MLTDITWISEVVYVRVRQWIVTSVLIDLHGEVNDRIALYQTAHRDDIDLGHGVLGRVRRVDVAACFHQHIGKGAFQLFGRLGGQFWFEIVQHDHIGTCLRSSHGFIQSTTLYFNLKLKTRIFLGL